MAAGSGPPDRVEATASILRVLAALAPDRRAPDLDRSGAGPTSLAWLGVLPPVTDLGDATSTVIAVGQTAPTPFAVPRSPAVEALSRHDALTPDADDLRVGWVWVVGEAEVAGAPRRIVLPLLSRPVRVTRSLLQSTATPLGPWDLWPLVEDRDRAAQLERDAQFGGGGLEADTAQALVDRLPRLRAWVRDVVVAAGLPAPTGVLAPTDPTALPRRPDLVAVVGYSLYVDRPVDVSHPRETLTSWSRNRAAAATALASIYLDRDGAGRPPPPAPAAALAATLPPTLPLDHGQAEVVLRARTAPITVVSGPPGTGKSQTAAAVALDCVARGESVLLATRSSAAADVLAGLLERLPGPDPVLFGGSERAQKLAARLADGLASPVRDGAGSRLAEATRHHAELEAALLAGLDDVAAADRWAAQVLTLARHSLVAPHLLDPHATGDPVAARELLDEATRPGGWFGARRRRKATLELRRLVGAPPDVALDDVAAALDVALLRARAERASRRDPAVAERTRSAWFLADDARRSAAAEALAADVARRGDGDARRALAALATALRAGRATRRAHLAAVDVGALTTALPLWVGTLGDIETLLPPTAGAFDVVILDEASQIDQGSASAALLRARRAVVVGDPRQLRFVSFVPDADVGTAITAEGCGPIADRLDVRRVSAFDLGAGAAPVTFLDQHYRSVPHLIEFSARRFYDGRLAVATRHPRNHDTVAIDVRHLAGTRTDGVNEAEVSAAVDEVLERLAADPGASVGVISPYRRQVEALEARLGERVALDALQAGRVRVGTVHAFQGSECDVVVASFGIGGAADRGRRFLEDPNLFNVLVTRARHRLVVLVSGDEPTTGLLADYLRWARTPPVAPPDATPADDWTGRLAEAVRDAGTVARTGYPVGHWEVDLVVGEGEAAVAVATRLHPDGPARHLDRHLALHRAGWSQAEAFRTDGDAVRAALALCARAVAP